MLKTPILVTMAALSGMLLSCNLINPAEDIPSYIKVDSVVVKVTNFDQGSASHKMTCIKLNVGGTSLGFFELPTMTPCLITGMQSIYFEPGIELNGITGSRIVYPFFKPYTGTGKIDLVRGEIITIVPETAYKPECKFSWMEDFEDAGVSFIYPEYSDTTFHTQTDTVREGRFSGAVYLDSRHKFFEATSSTDFDLPDDGSMILLEFDYRSNRLLEFGVYVLQEGAAMWNSLVFIRPINHWNRIYLDLNTIVGDNQSADGFRPGFRAKWDSTGFSRQTIFMDNLKLIHF